MNYFIAVFGLIISAFSVYYGWKLLRLHHRVRGWNKTMATIRNKAVVPKKLASSSRAGHTVAIDYEYFANGISIRGNRVFLVEFLKGEKGFLKPAAQKFLDELPQQHEIFYDPQNPGESVMFCDGGFWYYFVFVFGCLLALGSIVYLFA